MSRWPTSCSPAQAIPGGQGLPALTLGYNTGGGHEDPAQFIQGNLTDVGVNVTLEGYEWGTYLDLIQAGQSQLLPHGVADGLPHHGQLPLPAVLLRRPWTTSPCTTIPEVDALLDEARSTADEDERLALYQEAERMILEDAPVIPLMYYKTSRVYGDGIGGYIRSADDLTPMERVYFMAE